MTDEDLLSSFSKNNNNIFSSVSHPNENIHHSFYFKNKNLSNVDISSSFSDIMEKLSNDNAVLKLFKEKLLFSTNKFSKNHPSIFHFFSEDDQKIKQLLLSSSPSHHNDPSSNSIISPPSLSISSSSSPPLIEDPLTNNYNSNLFNFSITNTSHSSSLPTEQEKLTLELNAKPVSLVDVEKISSRMNEQSLDRWKHLQKIVFSPEITPSPNIEQSYHFLPRFSETLLNNKIIERVDESVHGITKGCGRAFVVKETKVDDAGVQTDRLRFIFWPKKHNDWLEQSGYRCQASLRHISFYLDAVLNESGATADASSGFFQIPIPEHARCWFRFMDAAGNIYQMTRIPMGISPAVEMMQLIMEVLIGSPLVCKPQFSINYLKHQHAYVDDIRISGSTSNVQRACQQIIKNALDLNVTLKTNPSPSSNYVFLGAHFDHQQHSVSIGPKLKAKIPSSFSSTTIVAKDLHSLIGRLIHSAGMLRLPLISYMFCIKWCARKFNQVNRGNIPSSSLIDLPQSVVKVLNSWCAVSHNKKLISPAPLTPHLTFFVDASLQGWGVTVITHNSQVFHAGGKWEKHETHSDNSRGIISLLEAKAFRNCVLCFSDLIVCHRNVDFRIDNTSVQSGVHRGAARSLNIIEILRHPIEFLAAFDVVATVAYVKSNNNIADAKSRNDELPFILCDMANNLYKRQGGGGNWISEVR